jgi:integrase
MNRRADGEGNYEKVERKSGTRYRLVKSVEGKIVVGPWEINKKLALDAFNEKRQKPTPSQAITLSTYLRASLGTRRPGSNEGRTGHLLNEYRPKTWDNRESFLRSHIENDPIGHIQLDHLTTTDIHLWMLRVKSAASGKSNHPTHPGCGAANSAFTWLKGMLRRARRSSPPLMTTDPCEAIKLFAVPDPSESKTILEPDEMRSLIERINFLPDPRQGPKYGAMTRLRLKRAIVNACHGIRPSENLGLRNTDWIQIDDGWGWQIEIQSLAIRGLRYLGDPKNERGFRKVPIAPEFHSLFQDLPAGFILATRSGKPMGLKELEGYFGKLVKGTAWEGMKLYDLRSCYAMAFADSKENPRVAAEIMGHTPEMMVRKYMRANDRRKSKATSSVWSTPTEVPTEKSEREAI